MSKIRVPHEMSKAVEEFRDQFVEETGIEPSDEQKLKAALAWLANHAHEFRPTLEETHHFLEISNCSRWSDITAQDFFIECVRRMFLAPEPEVPEEIKDLLVSGIGRPPALGSVGGDWANAQILEAYRRGQKAGKP